MRQLLERICHRKNADRFSELEFRLFKDGGSAIHGIPSIPISMLRYRQRYPKARKWRPVAVDRYTRRLGRSAKQTRYSRTKIRTEILRV